MTLPLLSTMLCLHLSLTETNLSNPRWLSSYICRLQTKTRSKWVILYSYLFSRTKIIDFHQATGCDGTHPEMFSWIKRYFSCSVNSTVLPVGSSVLRQTSVPPLYLQHQGLLCIFLSSRDHTSALWSFDICNATKYDQPSATAPVHTEVRFKCTSSRREHKCTWIALQCLVWTRLMFFGYHWCKCDFWIFKVFLKIADVLTLKLNFRIWGAVYSLYFYSERKPFQRKCRLSNNNNNNKTNLFVSSWFHLPRPQPTGDWRGGAFWEGWRAVSSVIRSVTLR